ncbi:MAG: hypothetical protein RL477_329, partial [Pseudomonadota bacterium]
MRAAYFDSLLTRARERFGWQIGVLCKFIDRRRYTHLAATPAAIHLIPHWHDPQPWEADAAEVTALEQLVRECEDRSGVALNRMLLAAERDLGAAYNLGSHYFPRHGGVRELLADNKLPARVALRVFRFVRDALDAEKPDLIVAGAATSPVPFATFLLARRRGIPFVMNRHSKVWSDTAFWTDRFDMANALGQARFDARRATNAAVSTEAKAHIAKFRDTPVTVAYIRANWRAAAGRTWWSQHRGFASEAVGGILARMREPGRKGKPLLARMGHFYRSRWLLARQDGMYQTPSDEQLRAMRYVYLPLHKEPELALNFLSP